MHKLNSGATLLAVVICIILFTVVASDKRSENSLQQTGETIVKMTG